MSDTSGIPAAWYPDPGDARQLRYWDGVGWTGQIAPNPTLAPAPSPAPTYTAPVDNAPAYVPLSFTHQAVEPSTVAYEEVSPNTAAIWLYVFVPLLLLAQLYLPVSARLEDLLTDLGALAARGGLALAFVIAAIVLAAIDGHRLREGDFAFTPPAVLAVLPPVHMVVRLLGTGIRSLPVTLLALVVQLGVGLLLVTQLPLLLATPEPVATDGPSSEGMVPPYTREQVEYLLTSEGMAKKILYDAHNTALHYDTVECVPLSSTDLGAQTTCEATSNLADYLIRVQVLSSSDGTPFIVTTVTPSIHT